MDEKMFDWAVELAQGALIGGAVSTPEDAVEFAFHCYKELSQATETISDESGFVAQS